MSINAELLDYSGTSELIYEINGTRSSIFLIYTGLLFSPFFIYLDTGIY